MYRTISAIAIVMSTTLLAVAPIKAADENVKPSRQNAGTVKPHRHCDWIGPGGRAVYRCGLSQNIVVKAARPALVLTAEPAPQRTCDWIGPGGRAVYRCQTIN
jgi:hypothetical protein